MTDPTMELAIKEESSFSGIDRDPMFGQLGIRIEISIEIGIL
jgi:hypothetical protein